MIQNDLIYIENELNISIPDRYREIALNPILDKLKNSRFEPDILYSDPKKIVKANQRLRKNGIYGSEPLRSNHLIIGYSGFELYYIYIDVSEERDVLYSARRAKWKKYTPDNPEINSLGFSLIDGLKFYIHNLLTEPKNSIE